MQPKVKDLCLYRLEKSREELKAAQVLLKENLYSQSLNRSYYAIFMLSQGMLPLNKLKTLKSLSGKWTILLFENSLTTKTRILKNKKNGVQLGYG